jgi:hypothetical protein
MGRSKLLLPAILAGLCLVGPFSEARAESSRLFASSAVEEGTSGEAVSIDLAVTQSAPVADDAAGWSVGTSFVATADPSPLTFTGTTIGTGTLGDANGDGLINGADLNIVLSNYHRTGATLAMGDFNGDSKVDSADFRTVILNYNRPVVSSAEAVPEPSTLALVFALAAAGLAWRFRKLRRW